MAKTIRGGTVPIVVSYRKVTKKPVVKRTRAFVGFGQMLRNIAVKAIEFVEDVAYETTNEVLDAGEQKVVHWAIEVDDPWGVNPRSELVAMRVSDKPACGAHFEVISVMEEKDERERAREMSSGGRNGNDIPPALLRASRPPQAEIRERMRARLASEGASSTPSPMPSPGIVAEPETADED